MASSLSLREVGSLIRRIRRLNVILDRDVAALYGVQTREVNQAVKNNPDKFPRGYVIELTADEVQKLDTPRISRSKDLTFPASGRGRHSKYPPKAFTEKGLYMLATILKGKTATQTTLAIVETFAKLRELSAHLTTLSETPAGTRQKTLAQKSRKLLSELLGEDRTVTTTETTLELNLAILKVKHTVKRGEKK